MVQFQIMIQFKFWFNSNYGSISNYDSIQIMIQFRFNSNYDSISNYVSSIQIMNQFKI